MSTPPRTTCAALGCSRPVTGHPWSAYCSTHGMKICRNGAPHARALKHAELMRHREPVARTLAKYLESSAVKSALMLADDVLTFRPRHDFGYENEMREQMLLLRDHGVTAREVLQRVCEIWCLQAFDQRFSTDRELHHALARGVLKLRRWGLWRPGSRLLRSLGRELQEQLGTFATGLYMQIEKDHEVRAQAKKNFETGWTIRGEAP